MQTVRTLTPDSDDHTAVTEQDVLSVRGITRTEGRPLGYCHANIAEGKIIYVYTMLKNHTYTQREKEGVIKIKDKVSNLIWGKSAEWMLKFLVLFFGFFFVAFL